MRAFAAAAALALASSSCSSSRDDAPTLGVVRSAIIGGATSTYDHDAVVLLAHEDARGEWEFTCTATLIAPNLLVTARHCLSAIDDPDVACDASGKQVAGGTVGADRAVEA